MANNKETKDLTGLETTEISDRKSREATEYNLLENLLKTAEFIDSKEAITEVDIKRKGEVMFTLHIRPVSDQDIRRIRKQATTYMPNPANRKLPPIEKEFNTAKFNSLLVYAASTREDQESIWGNKTLMQKYDLVEPWETVDRLLLFAEKSQLCDIVYEISGGEEEATLEDYAKN